MTVDVEAFRTPHAWRNEFAEPGTPDYSRVLDRPSPTPAILTMLMHHALLGLILTADGATAGLGEKVSLGKAGESKAAPTSSLADEVTQRWRDFSRCRTNRSRLLVIREAQARNVALRFAPDRSEVRGTVEWREKIARDPRSRRVLAEVYGIGAATVSRIRRQAKVA